jgi:hypothetical protein
VPAVGAYHPIEIPVVPPETVDFLTLDATGEPPRGKDFLSPSEAVRLLRKLRCHYLKKIEKDIRSVRPALQPGMRSQVPPSVYLATLYHDSLLSRYFCLERDFERWCIALCDEMLAFLVACQRCQDHVAARCDVVRLTAHIRECYESRPSRTYSHRIQRMRRYLQRFTPPFRRCTSKHLKGVLARVVALVDRKSDWVPPNEFDAEFAIFAECNGLVAELAEVAVYLRSGDKPMFFGALKRFCRGIDVRGADEYIVLKHTFFRWCFDFLHVHGMTLTSGRSATESFLDKCAFIASCSARSLGIPQRLLRPDQMDHGEVVLRRPVRRPPAPHGLAASRRTRRPASLPRGLRAAHPPQGLRLRPSSGEVLQSRCEPFRDPGRHLRHRRRPRSGLSPPRKRPTRPSPGRQQDRARGLPLPRALLDGRV